MKLKLSPSKLYGSVTPPASKSQAHRIIVAASLAAGVSKIDNLSLSQDILATLDCMNALGAVCSEDGSHIVGIGGNTGFGGELPRLNCRESGSTLRFLIPVALAVAGGGIFTGAGRLMDRPQGPYESLFKQKGIVFEREGCTLCVEGELKSGVFELPGNVSSQFISGLLFALPLLDGDSEIRLTSTLESVGYVNMTVSVLKRFGVRIVSESWGLFIPGRQSYVNRLACVEADYSQAAFYYAARALGNEVLIKNLNRSSEQGDRVIEELFVVLQGDGDVTIDVRDCPDLVPPLALIAALRQGKTTEIVGAARLRMKESDRLDTVTTQLNALGAQIEQRVDSLTVRGVDVLSGGAVSGCNDHRIAMMLAMAATAARGSIVLDGAECVGKSYPNFWEHYVNLGGKLERMD